MAKLTNRTIASTLQDILNVTGDTNGVYRGDSPVSDYLNWNGVRFANCQSLTDLASRGAGYFFGEGDDYIQVVDNNNIDVGTADFSIHLKMIPYSVSGTQYLVNKENSGIGYGLYTVDDDLYIRFDDGTTDASGLIASAVFSIGVLVDVHVTFDRDGNATAYINGIPKGTIDISSANLTLSNSGALRWGSKTAGGDYFDGIILEGHIFNLALTQSEIQEIMMHGVPYKYCGASQSELLRNYDLDNLTDAWSYTATIIDETTVTKSSGHSWKMTIDTGHSSGICGRYLKDSTGGSALQIGKRYRISCWINTADGTATITAITIRRIDASHFQGNLTKTGNVSGNWEEWKGEFTCIDNSGAALYIQLAEGEGAYAYIDEVSLKQIGCVLQLEPSGIGHNQWIDLSGNELHGTVSGATPFNLPANHEEIYKFTATANTTFTLPKGYAIDSIVCKETTNHTITGLKFGFTSGGSEIVASADFAANDVASLTILQRIDTFDADDTVYITADNWNSASLDIVVRMKRMVV